MPKKTSSSSPKILNAYDFNEKVISKQKPNEIFHRLSDELDYYFFSHMHDVELELLSREEVTTHFYDFFEFLINGYQGTDITKAYSSYYVKYRVKQQHSLFKQSQHIQNFIWSVFYSFNTLQKDSLGLNCIKFAIENSINLDVVKLLHQIRNMVGTVCSIPPQFLQLDNLLVANEDLSQVLAAIFEEKMIKKMHLLEIIKKKANEDGIVASELAIVLLNDFIKNKTNIKNSEDRAKERTQKIRGTFFSPTKMGNHILNKDDAFITTWNKSNDQRFKKQTVFEQMNKNSPSKRKKKNVSLKERNLNIQQQKKESLMYSPNSLISQRHPKGYDPTDGVYHEGKGSNRRENNKRNHPPKEKCQRIQQTFRVCEQA